MRSSNHPRSGPVCMRICARLNVQQLLHKHLSQSWNLLIPFFSSSFFLVSWPEGNSLLILYCGTSISYFTQRNPNLLKCFFFWILSLLGLTFWPYQRTCRSIHLRDSRLVMHLTYPSGPAWSYPASGPKEQIVVQLLTYEDLGDILKWPSVETKNEPYSKQELGLVLKQYGCAYPYKKVLQHMQSTYEESLSESLKQLHLLPG